MAVVVKEASKTPLAIAALADNMAKTYLQYAQNETAQAQWEQEATWRNQDREYERQERERLEEERSRLGGIAQGIGSMDESMFIGGSMGRDSAAYTAGQGKDWTDYLADTAEGEDTSLSSHYLEKQLTEQYVARQMGLAAPNPSADAVFISMYARPKIAKDQTGMDMYALDPINNNVIGEINKGPASNAWTQILQGGNGATTVGTPEGTGSLSSYPDEASARAAARNGAHAIGDKVIIAGRVATIKTID